MSRNIATIFDYQFFLVTICRLVNNQIFCIIYYCEEFHRHKYICIIKSHDGYNKPNSHSFFGPIIVTESYFDSCDDICNSWNEGYSDGLGPRIYNV